MAFEGGDVLRPKPDEAVEAIGGYLSYLHRRHDLIGDQRDLILAQPEMLKNAGMVAIPQ